MKKDFYTLPVSLELPFLSDFQIPISFKDVLFVFCCFDMSFSGDEVRWQTSCLVITCTQMSLCLLV